MQHFYQVAAGGHFILSFGPHKFINEIRETEFTSLNQTDLVLHVGIF